MITKCIKLTIYPYNNKLDKNKIYKEMHDLSYNTRKACNYAMSLQFNETMRQVTEKEELGKVRSFKDIHGVTFNGYIYHPLKEYMVGSNSDIVSATRRFVTSKANYNATAVLKGEESLTTFRSNMPIFLSNKVYKVQKEEDGLYFASVGFFTQDKNKELGQGANERINFAFLNPDNNLKSTLNKLISKEYKQGASQIQYDKRKKKWYMTISYSFEPQVKELNPNRILGVDLGVVKVATMSIYDSDKKRHDKIYWKEQCIDGAELIHYRQKIEARRKQMQIATKWASDNKVGHGRKQRMRDVDKIGDKYARFRDTYNHKVSRYIVDLAVKYNCGTIQMENLSGFSDMQSESLLKNWSYYDLQSKIEYKAKEKGIVVNLINPKFTSQRCSKCGCIDAKNRDCKNNQAQFKCVECGHSDNADINASKNIALPDIEMLIEDYIKNNKNKEVSSKAS